MDPLTDPYADVPAALLSAVNRDDRRVFTAGGTATEGIDFVENVPAALARSLGLAALAERRTLLVHLLHGPVPADWDAGRVRIVGGVRSDPALNPVLVAWAAPASAVAGTALDPDPAFPPGVTPDDRALVRASVAPERRTRVFVIRTMTLGDLSDYLLRIVPENDSALPPGLDAPLAQDQFSFRIDCANPLDCLHPTDDAVVWRPQPILDYLARDYAALRIRLLDRLTALMPEWTDRNPADLGVTLAELFAYLGDQWAYAQDAAAVEAYLTTARHRVSVRRHARLISYPMHDGCSARTWLAVDWSGANATLPAGTAVGDEGGADDGASPRTAVQAADAGACVFETAAPILLRADRTELGLHTWADPDHTLPMGATAAFVTTLPGQQPRLRAGDVLILAELPPGGARLPQLGDPAHRYVVRLERDAVPIADPDALPLTVWELRWVVADALSGPLRVSERGPDGRPIPRAVALANVVLAVQGATVHDEALPVVPGAAAQDRQSEPYRPRLARRSIASVDPVPQNRGPGGGFASATEASHPRADRALADVRVDDGLRRWSTRRDLIGSSPIDNHVVVESDDHGVSRLRFGDGVSGRRAPLGADLVATYRTGTGAAGNVAAGALSERLQGGTTDAIELPTALIWNPLPATGGRDPEPVEVVRDIAPHAFRRQLRAVTTEDHAAVAEQIPAVQRAVARRRWNGSWQVVETTLDPRGTVVATPWLAEGATRMLEIRRMSGLDVEVHGPVFAPLLIAMSGCALPGFLAVHIVATLQETFSARMLPLGRRGFFHPDRFTFGRSVELSDVVATAMGVSGLAWVRVTGFGRLEDTPAATTTNLAAGEVRVGARELIRCESDPNRPENGRVEITVTGGS